MSIGSPTGDPGTPPWSPSSDYSSKGGSGSRSIPGTPLTPLTPAPGPPFSPLSFNGTLPVSSKSWLASSTSRDQSGLSSPSTPSSPREPKTSFNSTLPTFAPSSPVSSIGSVLSDALDLATYLEEREEDNGTRNVRIGTNQVFKVDRWESDSEQSDSMLPLLSSGTLVVPGTPQSPITPLSPSTPMSSTIDLADGSSSQSPPTPTSPFLTTPTTPVTPTPPSVLPSPVPSSSSSPPLTPLTPYVPSTAPALASKHKTKDRDIKNNRSRDTHLPRPPKLVLSQSQQAVRLASLYLVPMISTVPLSLVIHAATHLLSPLYTTTLMSLHHSISHMALALTAAALLSLIIVKVPIRDVFSARVCLTLVALFGDLSVVVGRRVGYLSAKILNPEWGAVFAMVMLNLGSVIGASSFALLCFDHAVPIPRTATKTLDQVLTATNVSFRVAIYYVHVFYSEKAWGYILGGGSVVGRQPEKTILFISLIFTICSLLVQQDEIPARHSNHKRLYKFLSKHLDLSPQTSTKLKQVTNRLPHSVLPLLFLLRLPLLVLALRQQIFLRPAPPYFLSQGDARIISSVQGVGGTRVVVGDNLLGGYRFLRKDGVILGGRFTRRNENSTSISLGDSIYPGGMMVEIGLLARRHSEADSLARTISMTTELQLVDEENAPDDDKLKSRALVLGVGVGVSSVALTKRGVAVDIVEQDETVYNAVEENFNLKLHEESTTSLLPADAYIDQITEFNKEVDGTMIKWSHVFHDLASGIPHSPTSISGPIESTGLEGYTKEFWTELADLVEVDGIVAIMIPGRKDSRLWTRILITILSTFTQCRAFADPPQTDGGQDLVLICTMAYSPLLSFRRPTRSDVLRSPLRSHVYSHFLQKEVLLTDLVSPFDFADGGMILTRTNLGNATVGTDMITLAWRRSNPLLSSQMWLSW